ncbi:pyridoxamine 5'-phosphate oxidase family protein [Catenulispora rubra]|uniref:pyridoxamine 5'-phosphate oxidase family protein n=1 Tax=Catenulispora rubra TaxID=280293 RepID=UPI001892368F|nr:pyridoxamine 5'-phosphate oxidase family protein [Catenulispora rubra]
MTEDELDEFLREEPICRVATIGPGGHPHVGALWFVWDGTALWLNSLTRSQRWTDLDRDRRISVVVDTGGTDFLQLKGAELTGRAELVGEAPRTGAPVDELREPELLFAGKYAGGRTFAYDGRHAWVRLTPQKIVSWDFAKIRR